MCKYCEKMEPLALGSYSNGETLEVTLVPIACGKNFSPAYIIVDFDLLRNGIKGNGVYSESFQISYCPKCGRNLNEST